MLKNLILFCAAMFFTLQNIAAQNINGFEIYVSKDNLSSITFHSDVNSMHFKEKTSPYKISTLGSNVILIQTSAEVKEPYNLVVTEGGRNHRFQIIYKDNIDLSEQDVDYSDLKKLEKTIADFNKKQSENNTSSSTQNNIQVNTNTITAPEKKQDDNTIKLNNQNDKATVKPSNNSDADNNFYVLIDSADNAKKKQQFAEAKIKYEKALQLKPDNDYALNKLNEVKKIIENQSGLKYTEILTKANNAFASARYEEALKYYNDALALKPGDVYSGSQINLIKKNMEAAKALEANRYKDSVYNNYLIAGDKNAAAKSYDGALIAYTEALKIKPDDILAKSKINTLQQKIYTDSIEAENKAKDNYYNSFINSGNKALQEKSYDAARMAYNEALKIKPNDVLAVSKLNSINQQLVADSMEAEKTRTNGLHDNYIKSADQAFKNSLYDAAKNDYNEALKLNANDTYAKSQVKKIDDILEQLKLQAQKDLQAQQDKERGKQYADLIAAADNYYNSEMFTEALEQYQKAILINKNDTYSKNKISQINNLLSQQKQKARQDSINTVKYTALVLKADEDLNNKNYTDAKSAYLSALKLKSGDTYVTEKLATIETAQQYAAAQNQAVKDSIAKNKENTKQYNALITKAKNAYSKNDYVMARGFYISAATLMPDETEAKNKVAEIDNKLNDMALQEQQKNASDSLISIADVSLIDSDYTAAVNYYQQALTFNQADQTYYINKQISFAQKQIARKDSLNGNAQQLVNQENKIKEAKNIYKLGTSAIMDKHYDSALLYFQQYVNFLDTLGFTSVEYDTASLKKYSKKKINDIESYLERQKNAPKDTIVYKLPDVKTLPSISVITYYNPKDPKLEPIYKKYPDIDFNRSPDEQRFDSLSDYSIENKLISRKVMTAVPLPITEASNNGVKLICQNIIFIGEKIYIKLMLQNSNAEEFLTGTMLLTKKLQDGSVIKILPTYVSAYPIVLSNQEKIVVYVIKLKQVGENESYNFELNSRLNNNKIELSIPENYFKQN